jgi:hypothetical protein
MSEGPRDASLAPGYDEEDPYEEVNLDTYPTWWRKNIEEFREYGLRPYRPARFNDGVLVPILVHELNERWNLDITFSSVNPHTTGTWEIRDGQKLLGEVKHERVGEGYTVYDIDTREFIQLIFTPEDSKAP